MRTNYRLFNSHLDLAHDYWKRLVQPGDAVIDATCGNGHDTLALAQLVLTPHAGDVFAFDLQKEAVLSTKKHLSNHLSEEQMERVYLIEGCHSEFPDFIKSESITLIVYNLGYLPGGNKEVTTLTESTLESLQSALSLIKNGGTICVTCYPGHEAGKVEEEGVLSFAATLDPKIWSVCHHRWLNRKNSPSLLLLQKSLANLPE